MRYRTSEEPTSRSVLLLLSYAVRYPEIATVRYDPHHQTLRLSFLITGPVGDEEAMATERKLRETLEVYHMLEQRTPAVVEFSHESIGDLCSMSLERDCATMTPEELYTIVEVIRGLYQGLVISESIDLLGEEEMMAQDELIEQMLASLAERRSKSNLIAIREDGRLMLFHK